jgi:glycerol-3-phosphate dehydrogenase subunit B
VGLQEVVDELLAATRASRCTLRQDVPRDFFPVPHEALAPGVPSIRDERTTDLRRAPVVRELIETQRQVVQQDCARAFDDPAFRAAVTAQVVGRLGAEERVAFPAVLGIADPHAAWAELEHRLGRPVFEVPTLPPSVPGMRVFATLREALRRAGGRVILNAVVTGAERQGARVGALRARVGLRDQRHGADWVVLATGGFASGGLELDSRWTAHETALGLPVSGVPGPGEERFRPGYFEDHPMGRAGVAVDRELRPVGDAGERLLENVLVAGATLAGAEPWREKSGDGLSLATGHRAAELVLAASTSAAHGSPAAART